MSIEKAIANLNKPVINKRHVDGVVDLTSDMTPGMTDDEIVSELKTLISVRFPGWSTEKSEQYIQNRVASLRKGEKPKPVIRTEIKISYGDVGPGMYRDRAHFAYSHLKELKHLLQEPIFKKLKKKEAELMVNKFVDRCNAQIQQFYGDGPDLMFYWNGNAKFDVESSRYLDD